MRRIYSLSVVLVVLSLLLVGCFGVKLKDYSVSGVITDAEEEGKGIPGVELALEGPDIKPTTVESDENGKWGADGLKGTVKISPRKEGWTFEPEVKEVSAASTEVNFEGRKEEEPEKTYTVLGVITDAEEAGIPDVEISLSGDEIEDFTVETDEDGKWAAEELKGTVTVKPYKEGWSFEPEAVEVSEARTDVNFVGTEEPVVEEEYNVSGSVLDLRGVGVQGVTVDFIQDEKSLGTVTTDEEGKWAKSNLTGTVKVVLSKDNWEFNPGSLIITKEDAEEPLSFLGTCYNYSVSGVVVDDKGKPLPGVQVLFFEDPAYVAVQDSLAQDSLADYAGKVITGPDGKWKMDGLSEVVTIVPTKATYRFLPQVQEFVRATEGVKFTGLSGLVTHADGEGVIHEKELDEYRVELTAEATHEDYSFVAWVVTTVADDPDNPAVLVQVEEEFREESITVELDGPVKAIAYFQIVDARPYVVGTFDVVHSFPMALEELLAPEEGTAAADLRRAPKFDAEIAGSFVPEFEGEERIVLFDHFDYDKQSAQLIRAGYKVLDHIKLLNAYLVEPDPAVTLRKELQQLDGVFSVERNGIVRPFALNVPNDQLYFAQWHYQQIRLAQAWSVTTGSKDIRVAVVDTGIDPDHTDLQGQLDLANMADFTADGDGLDYHGHGTHVAGTIGAVTDNEILMSGVMWDVNILPVKVFDASGRATNWTVVQGMLYAAGLLDEEGKPFNPEPVDIINLSLGGGWTQLEADAVEAIDAAGVIIVAAAGNDGEPMVSYPAAHPQVIAVGAVGKVDIDDPDGFIEPPLAGYSNWGSAIDVVAPGGAGRVVNDYVWSTYPSYLHPAGGEYGGMAGTSMACPHVAGVVGLMLSAGIEKEDIRDILHRTSMDIHLPTPNVYFGHGLINAYWAVNALDDGDFRFIQGLRKGNKVEEINSVGLPLKGGHFHMDLDPGEYQFIAWIDVNKNGIVDAGDYYAETPILEIELGSGWRWMDEIGELAFDMEEVNEDEIETIRGAAIKIEQ